MWFSVAFARLSLFYPFVLLQFRLRVPLYGLQITTPHMNHWVTHITHRFDTLIQCQTHECQLWSLLHIILGLIKTFPAHFQLLTFFEWYLTFAIFLITKYHEMLDFFFVIRSENLRGSKSGPLWSIYCAFEGIWVEFQIYIVTDEARLRLVIKSKNQLVQSVPFILWLIVVLMDNQMIGIKFWTICSALPWNSPLYSIKVRFI